MTPQPKGKNPDAYPDRYNHGPEWAFWLPDNRMTEQRTWICPYGEVGDQIWVRETWCDANTDDGPCILYRADGERHLLSDDAYPVEYERYPGKNLTWSTWSTDLLSGREGTWRPSIFMYRWASRIQLGTTNIRVERLQEISEEDAKAEGVQIPVSTENCPPGKARPYVNALTPFRPGPKGIQTDQLYRAEFAYLWDSINKKRGFGWDVNPWLWVIDFKRIKPE